MSAKTDLFIPDNVSLPEAQARTSHLGIGAHQDDLEFMAYHGIATCYEQDGAWFSGIICTDGGGSVRTGAYANTTDAEMRAIRVEEQHRAAEMGQYSYIAQLGYTSATIKDATKRKPLVDTLEQHLLCTQPDVLYTHNPADKHATHVAVFHATLEALQRIPPFSRPKKVYGCEVWRDLDWLVDDDKVALDVSAHPELAEKLNACFESQIAGGKDYGRAVIGRRRANATFYDAHAVDTVDQLCFAMDLTPLIEEAPPTVEAFLQAKLDCFKEEIMKGWYGAA
ncbi:MAG: PIG-L family deacetylase [Verrucomicrobia bacterium]|jgi:LmbE family N-acetylglucosaminyl deacetylase|nr:PIG-L family deacetylase [Verrucomicrobiota bacterium]